MAKGYSLLKRALPAITERGYEEMGADVGMEATVYCGRIVYGNATKEEVTRVWADLLKYFRTDTEGMIRIADKLRDVFR